MSRGSLESFNIDGSRWGMARTPKSPAQRAIDHALGPKESTPFNEELPRRANRARVIEIAARGAERLLVPQLARMPRGKA